MIIPAHNVFEETRPGEVRCLASRMPSWSYLSCYLVAALLHTSVCKHLFAITWTLLVLFQSFAALPDALAAVRAGQGNIVCTPDSLYNFCVA